MSSISKSTLKFFKENITNENSKFIPVFRDIREIIREFREWFPIVFEENLKIEMPTDTERRYITPRECLRLQSFTDNFIMSADDRATYKQRGNAVNVEMLEM